MYQILKISLYIIVFSISVYATSSLRFDKICDVRNPLKVQLLWIILSMGIAYVVTQFLLAVMYSI